MWPSFSGLVSLSLPTIRNYTSPFLVKALKNSSFCPNNDERFLGRSSSVVQLKEGRFSKSASSVKGRVDVRTPRTQILGGRPFFEKASTKANARFCNRRCRLRLCCTQFYVKQSKIDINEADNNT